MSINFITVNCDALKLDLELDYIGHWGLSGSPAVTLTKKSKIKIKVFSERSVRLDCMVYVCK